jgi:hypothetical protein
MYAMRYTRYGSPDVLTRERVETPGSVRRGGGNDYFTAPP